MSSSNKVFSSVNSHDALNVVNDAQKADFDKMVAISGGALVEQRQTAYLTRWQEALVYIPRGARLLDIGGGWPIERIWRAVVEEREVRYHLLDIETALVEAAQEWLPRYGLPASNAAVGPNTHFPFSSGGFDVVFSSHCLEHSPDLAQTFNEISRVLTPEGLLFFAVPFGFDDSDEHLLYLDIEDWLNATEMAGFEVINYHVGQVYPMSGWDLCVIARRAPALANEEGLQNLVKRQSKMQKVLARPADPIFSYAGPIVRKSDHHILQGQGTSVTVVADKLEALLFRRHAWSGIVQVTAGKDASSGKIIDLYSRIPTIGAVDVRGLSGPVTVTVIGRDRGHSEQAVLHGALLEAP
ncbi:class I SAM-dependent methyltransferase [Microvirga sp. ACRRW]|uniref:class I SAM-dependent methyltransferase n=1 Tax=Microvirga sp. ACRRW TaxID=2918205 RepID=UPI001EF69A5A|nr:class I SAM-dependent methyltransferase [Microvirga sp. ACRRW]MCG7391644.1 class I SAM-dependent methyltransferase [Microvirga sp. ACRRW]